MFENYFFALGIVNNLILIIIFLSVKFSRTIILKFMGPLYLLLIIPAIYGIILAKKFDKQIQYIIFLGIFIAFLLLEGAYDFIYKVSFRDNWKLLIPYLLLYWSMNYGFIVMTWKDSTFKGGIILGLFIMQLFANIISHF